MSKSELKRICRVCGCSDLNACFQTNGTPCFWISKDLCSACASAEELSNFELPRSDFNVCQAIQFISIEAEAFDIAGFDKLFVYLTYDIVQCFSSVQIKLKSFFVFSISIRRLRSGLSRTEWSVIENRLCNASIACKHFASLIQQPNLFEDSIDE